MASESTSKLVWMGLITMVMVTVSLSTSLPSKRGFCLSLCGTANNVECPSGYECKSNGCGHQCYKTTFVQPPGCLDNNNDCEYSCPLGFMRDEEGCEYCKCDYSPLQQAAVGR